MERMQCFEVPSCEWSDISHDGPLFSMILFMSGTFVNLEVANHFRFSTGKALSLRELYLQQFSNKVGKYKEAIKSKLEMIFNMSKK